MAYLIDGNNLMGHLSPGERRGRESRYTLTAVLLTFQRHTRRRIILVFDGPSDDDLERQKLGPKFTILFPPPGGNADDVIQEVLALPFDRRRMVVVSSDREVKSQARTRGAEVMTCEEFEGELKKVKKKARLEREMSKPVERLTPLEMKLWLNFMQRGRR